MDHVTGAAAARSVATSPSSPGRVSIVGRCGRGERDLTPMTGLESAAIWPPVALFCFRCWGFSSGRISWQVHVRHAESDGWLVVQALNSIIAAYYYLRVIVAMYMRKPSAKSPWRPRLNSGCRAGAPAG
jgi:hypothetical protein